MDVDWKKAACSNVSDPDIFSPEGLRGEPKDRRIAQAKTICANCGVQADCLQWALQEMGDDENIWGGMTKDERRALTRHQTQ